MKRVFLTMANLLKAPETGEAAPDKWAASPYHGLRYCTGCPETFR